MFDFDDALILGSTRRGSPVKLRPKERETHMQVIGASRKGKTKFLEYMIRQDIAIGNGLCLIDPEGTLYREVLGWCATNEALLSNRRIHVFDPSAKDWVFGFNPLRFDDEVELTVGVDAMVKAFATVWKEESLATPQIRTALRAIFYVLAAKKLTLLEALDLAIFHDPDGIRRYLTETIDDEVFRKLWGQFNEIAKREFIEQFLSSIRRLIEFLENRVIRDIIGQQARIVDFRRCMDEGDIVLINLAESDRVSPDNTILLGAFIVGNLLEKAKRRPEGSRPFHLYIDECYHYLNEDIESILDRCAKRGLHLVLAHQRLSQLGPRDGNVYNAVMLGAQTKVVFGLPDWDNAEQMARNVFLGEIEVDAIDRRFDKPTTVDYTLEWLEAEGEVETESGTVPGVVVASSETLDPEGEVLSTTGVETSIPGTEGFSRSTNWSRHQALRPELRWMATRAIPFEKVIYDAAAKIATLQRQQAIVKLPGRRSVEIRAETISSGYASEERIATFAEKLLRDGPYTSPVSAVRQEITSRREQLIASAAGQVHLEPTEEELWQGVRGV